MDPLARMQRLLKVVLVMFALSLILFVGLKFMAKRTIPGSDRAAECESMGRRWDTQRGVCLR
jgi:hypothetical protein